MDPKIKNVLGWVVVLGVLAVGYAALSFASSFDKSIPTSSLRNFSVTGQGKATAIPDVAEFQFEVITQGGTNISSLQSTNTNAANKVIAFVQSEGVASSDIQTQYYSVSPDYETFKCNIPVPEISNGSLTVAPAVPAILPCPPSSIAGYTITQSVDVKIRDFTKIGDILGGVVTNGANQVGQLSFTLDDPTAAQDTARANAIANAKTEAQAIAQAGGFKLGPLLSMQEGGQYNPYPMYSVGAAAPMGATAASTPSIQPGSEEIDMTETLQYEIE